MSTLKTDTNINNTTETNIKNTERQKSDVTQSTGIHQIDKSASNNMFNKKGYAN